MLVRERVVRYTARMRNAVSIVGLAGVLLFAGGCGSDSSGGDDDSDGSGGAAGASGSGGSANEPATGCGSERPAGAPTPAPLKAPSGGPCPSFVEGRNAITSAGTPREFLFEAPDDIGADEVLPVIFFWHWMGGDAQDFVDRGELAKATNDQRFLAIIPESIGAGVFGMASLDVKWPFDVTQSDDRVNQELTFFDDLLACAAEQYTVDRDCVSSAGVSAGALFTGQLAGLRGDYLASFVSLSGGTGGIIKPFANPAHKMPGLVLTGGPTDNCFNLLNFESQSATLKQDMTQGGHFLVECLHNCGHAQPPVTPAPGQSAFAPFWDFVFAHPFWLSPGDSPYHETGLPDSFPEWCAIGMGAATPRTGMCVDPSQC